MLSKNQQKYIRSLETKKGRTLAEAFVAEGPKVVGDLINAGMSPTMLLATREWTEHGLTALHGNGKDVQGCIDTTAFTELTSDELRKISFLQHPQQVMAVFPLPEQNTLTAREGQLILALDGVQDPRSLGTIIRIADWFGIEDIVCSQQTADAWNPKVVQATMGSIARVHLYYCDLPQWLRSLPHDTPIMGTLLDGDNIHEAQLQRSRGGVLVMGNEGNGITDEVRSLVNKRLLIPSYPADRPTAESLNVAIATAICCYEMRRQPQNI